MPKCPTPCTGMCEGHCVCVILGADMECRDAQSCDDLLALLDEAEEVRLWSDHPAVDELRGLIVSESVLSLGPDAGDPKLLVLRSR